MNRRMTRRSLLAGTAAGWAGMVSSTAGQSSSRPASSPSSATVSAYQFESCIWARVHDRTFCCYRSGREQKYPYFYPLLGPSGQPVTEESAVPWPHHRSLFLGCDRVNGGNYWQEGNDRGQIVSRGAAFEQRGGQAVAITDVCDWRPSRGEPIIEDRREFCVTAPDAATRVIDCRFSLLAKSDVAIEKTNHSLFSIRAAHDMTPAGGGELLNAHGESGEKGTFGRPAEWCGFQGRRAGRLESVVLMDHPANPWAPCKWFTRDYGFASPTPFFWLEDNQPWRLAAGKSVVLRYRVAVLADGLAAPTVRRLFDEFAAA